MSSLADDDLERRMDWVCGPDNRGDFFVGGVEVVEERGTALGIQDCEVVAVKLCEMNVWWCGGEQMKAMICEVDLPEEAISYRTRKMSRSKMEVAWASHPGRRIPLNCSHRQMRREEAGMRKKAATTFRLGLATGTSVAEQERYPLPDGFRSFWYLTNYDTVLGKQRSISLFPCCLVINLLARRPPRTLNCRCLLVGLY